MKFLEYGIPAGGLSWMGKPWVWKAVVIRGYAHAYAHAYSYAYALDDNLVHSD